MKSFACTALAAIALAIAPATATRAEAQNQNTRETQLAIPVTGSGGGATLAGTFQLTEFATRGGEVVALGTLTGTVTDAAGAVTSVVQNVVLPVNVTQATCDILHLDIGPISLDLLGLQIDLSRIVLDITAESGAGNLLGNLLCAVAGLLDDPGGLARLLNQILGLLG